MPSRFRLASISVRIALRERPLPLGSGRIGVIDLGRDHDLVSLREVAQGAADDLLARAVGVGVGGVEEIDAELEGSLDERPARFLVERPGMRLRAPARRSSCSRGRFARL